MVPVARYLLTWSLAAALLGSVSILPATAQPAPPAAGMQAPSGPLSYDQFKAWQMQRMTQARAVVDQRLAAPGLTDDQRQRLLRAKGQLDKFTGMPPDRQDKLLRRRFARLDTNHDRMVDPGELQAGQKRDRLQGLMGGG